MSRRRYRLCLFDFFSWTLLAYTSDFICFSSQGRRGIASIYFNIDTWIRASIKTRIPMQRCFQLFLTKFNSFFENGTLSMVYNWNAVCVCFKYVILIFLVRIKLRDHISYHFLIICVLMQILCALYNFFGHFTP